MTYQLNYVAMHITNECTHKCAMCYHGDTFTFCEGNIEVLKSAALEFRKAHVNEICLVGGDPAEHSKIKELLEYLHELGFKVSILSNTHKYKNSSVAEITPFVDSLEWTLHGPTESIHDNFCKVSGAHRLALTNLKEYLAHKKEEQQLGIIMNIMPHNYNELYNSIESVMNAGLTPNYMMIQRIGAYGRADGKNEFMIGPDELNIAFEQIKRINDDLGVDAVPVDAYPFCIIPEEYHYLIAKCDWGYGTASMDMYGNLSRCAVASDYSLGNVLKTPLNEIWNNSPSLQLFRSKEYLRSDCQSCESLDICGGGCPISSCEGCLSNDALIRVKQKNKYNSK